MSNSQSTQVDDGVLVVQIVHVVGRLGLSIVGAMCGTFVAAQLPMTNAALFDSVDVVAIMVLVGILGFYMGIDIPHLRALLARFESPKYDSVELLSKIGIFLAALTALISVYAFVFDKTMRASFEYTVASWWTVGVVLQIGARLIGRIRRAKTGGDRSTSYGRSR